jgi:hypothetical protein
VGKVNKAGNPMLAVCDAKLVYHQRYAISDHRCTLPKRSMALDHDAAIHRLGIEATRAPLSCGDQARPLGGGIVKRVANTPKTTIVGE